LFSVIKYNKDKNPQFYWFLTPEILVVTVHAAYFAKKAVSFP